jgi:hypothetical protein
VEYRGSGLRFVSREHGAVALADLYESHLFPGIHIITHLCHAERSEESHRETLHFVQGDTRVCQSRVV